MPSKIRYITVKVKCSDAVSGVDKVFMETKNGTLEGDTAVIGQGTSGELYAWSVDRCGNESEIYECDTVVLVDTVAPVVTVDREEADGGVRYEIKLSDADSGIWDASVRWNGKTIKKLDLSQESLGIYDREIKLRIEEKDVELGENKMEITCRDFAGNNTDVTNIV